MGFIWNFYYFTLFQLIKTFYKQVYMGRDGVDTVYNFTDRGLYYTQLPENNVTFDVHDVTDLLAPMSTLAPDPNVTMRPEFMAKSRQGIC